MYNREQSNPLLGFITNAKGQIKVETRLMDQHLNSTDFQTSFIIDKSARQISVLNPPHRFTIACLYDHVGAPESPMTCDLPNMVQRTTYQPQLGILSCTITIKAANVHSELRKTRRRTFGLTVFVHVKVTCTCK